MFSIILSMKSLYNAIHRKIERDSKDLNVSGVQFFVLKFLTEHKEEDIFQKDIEKLLNIRRSTATVILQNLTQKGYISRVPVSSDGRLKKIVLSKNADRLVKDFERKMMEAEEKVEKNLTEEEKKNFSLIVRKIKQNLEN